LHTTELANYNEFVSDPRLVGMKNGETTAARQTLASVWEFQSPSGPVPIAVIVLGSEDRAADTKSLVSWVEKNVEFK
jgi:D-alanyl-D-alanine carboxypeptidase